MIQAMQNDFDALLSGTVQQIEDHDDVQSKVCILTTQLIQIRKRYLQFESEITQATGINPKEQLCALKAVEMLEPI